MIELANGDEELGEEHWENVESADELFAPVDSLKSHSTSNRPQTFLLHYSATRVVVIRFVEGKWRLLVADGDDLDVSPNMVEFLEQARSVASCRLLRSLLV